MIRKCLSGLGRSLRDSNDVIIGPIQMIGVQDSDRVCYSVVNRSVHGYLSAIGNGPS